MTYASRGLGFHAARFALFLALVCSVSGTFGLAAHRATYAAAEPARFSDATVAPHPIASTSTQYLTLQP